MIFGILESFNEAPLLLYLGVISLACIGGGMPPMIERRRRRSDHAPAAHGGPRARLARGGNSRLRDQRGATKRGAEHVARQPGTSQNAAPQSADAIAR